MHKIKIYQKDNTHINGSTLTGKNTVIEIDDVKLQGVTRLSFDVNADGVAKLIVEMVGDVEVDASLSQSEMPELKRSEPFFGSSKPAPKQTTGTALPSNFHPPKESLPCNLPPDDSVSVNSEKVDLPDSKKKPKSNWFNKK